MVTAWLQRLAHPAILLWFLIGLGDWLVNLVGYHVMLRLGFRSKLSTELKRLGVDLHLMWRLTVAISLVLGPLAVLRSLYLVPDIVQKIRHKRAERREFNEKCAEINDDAVDLMLDLANCEHDGCPRAEQVRCPMCGATYAPAVGWLPSTLGAAAKAIVRSADDAGISLVCECPEGTHDK